MNIFEFQKAVEEKDFNRILELLKPNIEESEKYNSLMKNNRIQESEQVLEVLEVTAGLYGIFMVAKAILETKEEEEKNKEFLSLKEKENFKLAIARIESSNKVNDWSRLRAIAEAYAKMNEKNSCVCQSILSYLKGTYSMEGSKE